VSKAVKGDAAKETVASSAAVVEAAIDAYRKGRMVIIVDDADRENEGDFTMPAEDVTADDINFMALHGRGLICVPADGAILDRLELPMMVSGSNRDVMKTAFTVSVDSAENITTGISAADRAHTIKLFASDKSERGDFAMPGHVFPLRYREGGVLVRAGQTEGSVDLAKLAGKKPVTVICEIMNMDGSMARLGSLREISQQHNIPVLPIADLIQYRLVKERMVEIEVSARIPTEYGEFQATMFRNKVNGEEHLALAMGEFGADDLVPVRVHSECLTSDVFGSYRCDCGEQLRSALRYIADAKMGVIVYLRQEGRGIGLKNKLHAYSAQDDYDLDTVDANKKIGFEPDLRDYGIGAQILRELNVRNINLLTNNPKKVIGLEGFGLKLAQVSPLDIKPRKENIKYLKTKREKMGHKISADWFQQGAASADEQ